MLLALSTSTLGNFDADTLDKDENQVKTRSLDEDQDEDHGENHRFEGGMIDKFKNWARNKAKKFLMKIINTKLELDGYNLSDELKEKLIEEILTALKDIWKNPNKRIAENVAEIYRKYVSGMVTTGPAAEKPVESGNP
ncbi:Hypothetical predicted protein [Podarcis lilfordi]|uniref:Uncharacterized protein n=1 Tax=Podarcis lilfordi TaxID=74358 RepID=A0AA35KST1_9SAUR|nr:Hypothetical predicted protein [Podarcis lilfordi]